MGKKSVIMGLCMLGVLGIPLAGLASQTIDAPHVNLDSNAATEDCAVCHFALNKKTCTDCHTNATGGYSDLSAPKVSTHQGFKCQVCHNPHVSLQASGTPLVAGTFSAVGFDSGTKKSTLTVPDARTTNDSTFATPDSWTQKSVKGVDASKIANAWGAGRGLILWLKDSASTDMYSFEIDSVTAPGGVLSAIVVNGEVPAGITFDGTYQLFYGQLISTMVSPVNTDFRDGTSPVVFNNPKGLANASIPNGICQVCHTATSHWRADGSQNDHNVSTSCTGCHKHENVDTITPALGGGFGLGKDCIVCHSNYPEPPQTGMHALHAGTATAGGYAFACKMCHTSGMNASDITKDNKIEIGFNLAPLSTPTNAGPNFQGENTIYDGVSGTVSHFPGVTDYNGGNGTTVTYTGSKTCSNVYCHSNGYAANVVKCTTSPTNTSPAWDSQQPRSCQTCHNNVTYPTGFYPYATGTWGSYPNYNTHWAHIQAGKKCGVCHSATMGTTDNVTIANKSNHVNGTVNVVGSGITTWNATNHTCVNTCHSSAAWVNYNSTLNTNAADNVVCPTLDPAQVADNVSPTLVNWSAYAPDLQSLVLTASAYDPDYLNPAKNAKYVGGHNGAAGSMSMNWNNDLNSWDAWAMTEEPGSISVSHVFTDAAFVRAGGNGHMAPVEWKVVDNNPTAAANAKASTGLGWVSSGWQNIDLTTILTTDPMVNLLPRFTYTTSNVGTVITLTVTSYDPDAVDPVKAAYYGGGHAGTNGYLSVTWNNKAATNAQLPMQNVTPSVKAVTFDASTVGYTMGKNVWFSFWVFDNHYMKLGKNVKDSVNSGWQVQKLL